MQVNNSFFLTITFMLILLFGITFVTSSSVFEGFELSGDPFYFAKRQFTWFENRFDQNLKVSGEDNLSLVVETFHKII